MAKDTTIADTVKSINKKFGDGSIMFMGEDVGKPVANVPTGIYGVDHNVLGIGGFPKNRITEIYGPESSGKTTLALTAIADAQKRGEHAAIIDVEHALNPDWMNRIGVDVSKLLVSQPDYGEQALEILTQLIEAKAFSIIVVDSVAALVPKSELDGEIGDAQMGVQARMMGQMLRKLTPKISESNASIIFINQLRSKLGVTWGSNETTSGGRALAFYASARVDVRKISAIKEKDVIIGNNVRIKTVKMKVGTPYRETEVQLFFDRGFDKLGSLVDAAIKANVIEQTGAWFNYNGEKFQGKANIAQMLKENDKARNELIGKLKHE